MEKLLQRSERQCHPPCVAEGPQAQVDAVAESVGRYLVEQFRQLLPEAREPGLGRERARAIALAVGGIGVDQVDVGAEVELAAAELDQAEHDQPLPVAPALAHQTGRPAWWGRGGQTGKNTG